MRDWTEDQIKASYQSEYQDVPDVWDRVVDGVKSSEDWEPADQQILQFAKLGHKRMIRLCATIAACLVIIVGYVIEQGSFSFPVDDEKTNVITGGTEAPATAISGDTASARPESEVDSQVSADVTQNAAEQDNAVRKQNVWVQINGICYQLLWEEPVEEDTLASMQQIGTVEHTVTELEQIQDGDIYGMDITGKVYRAIDDTVLVIDDADGTGYRFVEKNTCK